MPRPMRATPKRLPLTISIIRLMPRPSRAASVPDRSAPRLRRRRGRPARPVRPSRVTSPVGTPDGPELGLQPLDAEAVGRRRRVVRLGTMKVARPRRALGGALGPGEDDEDVGVDVRAEVLLAEEAPFVAVLDGPGGVGARRRCRPGARSGTSRPPRRRPGRGCVRRASDSSRTSRGRVALDDVGGRRRSCPGRSRWRSRPG